MARSIVQKNHDRCYLCGGPAYYNDPLDKHHVFGGAFRKKSEKYGLTVWIDHFGRNYIFANPLCEQNHTCVVCGEIIPEGRQVCANCEMEVYQ